MKGAVLFDLDGTLLDTVPDIRLSLNETLAKFAHRGLTLDETRAFVGNGARKLVERALPAGSDVDAVCADFRARYAASANMLTRPYEGMPALISSLKARGIGCAVVTNKPAEAALATVEKFFGGLFDVVCGDSGAFPVKPDPAPALFAAQKMGARAEQCVFVGDGETDVETARNAGMGGVFVLWGYRTREQLAAAGATRFARDAAELSAILSRLLCGE